jgi:flagellar motor switch/type III secretory pathway protein FliN
VYRAKAQAVGETTVQDATPSAVLVETIRPAGSATDSDKDEIWAEATWLPCRLSVELAVPDFTIGDLLRLQPNNLLDCQWKQNADVPLRINGLLLGYAEFELLGDKTAVRVTELL